MRCSNLYRSLSRAQSGAKAIKQRMAGAVPFSVLGGGMASTHMPGVRGSLGIAFGRDEDGNIAVSGLQAGMPAAVDGRIRVGDVLLRIDRQPIGNRLER